MLFSIYGMGGVEIFQLVTGFRSGQGLFCLIDGGVCGLMPGESKNDVFLATTHDIEEVFLNNPFNVGIEGASVVDGASLVCSLVDVLNSDRGGKFFDGELVFSDKLPVNTGDVNTRVY